MSYQGKSKRHYDAAEFMAFIGVIGAGVSIIIYLIFLFLFFSE
jgi:hypothetical protein